MGQLDTGLPAQFPRYVKLLCGMFVIYGIDVRVGRCSAKKQQVSTSRHPLWCLPRIGTFVAFSMFVVGLYVGIYNDMPEQLSLLCLVSLANTANYLLIMILSGFTMMKYESSLSEIIFYNSVFSLNFNPRPFFIQLFLSVFSFGLDIYIAVRDAFSSQPLLVKLGSISGLYVWPLQYLTFCMYGQCESVILSELQFLSDFLRKTPISNDAAYRVACSKNSIRLLTAKVNRIFSEVLLVIYTKVIFLLATHFGSIALWDTPRRKNHLSHIFYVLASCVQVAQLFETTRLGSAIIQECLRAETILLHCPSVRTKIRPYVTRYREAEPDYSEHPIDLNEVRAVLSYNERIDALTISDTFVNSKSTMFKYLGTMFTCIAIVLQFDYDILNALDRAKSVSYL